MTNKFRNTNNSRYTKQLFYEMTSEKENVLYTLKDTDWKGYPSLYRLYMEMDDVTEYEFAMKYFDGWEHFQMICACSWFAPLIERWRQELDLRTKARALALIKKEATENGRNALAAAKYLMERGWEPKEKKPKVNKEEVKAEAEKIINEQRDLSDAMDRLGLKVIK